MSTQLRQFKYAVDYTDSLYRELDIVLFYREQGLPDYEMYLFGEIISPYYFDREYETLIRKLSLWITKIQEFEGQPDYDTLLRKLNYKSPTLIPFMDTLTLSDYDTLLRKLTTYLSSLFPAR